MANFPDINPKYDEILLSKKVVRETAVVGFV
jgi:hypothetical protein